MPPTLSPAVAPDKPKLLEQVRDVIRRKHFSIRTEQAYTDWIRRFILFHRERHPSEEPVRLKGKSFLVLLVCWVQARVTATRRTRLAFA